MSLWKIAWRSVQRRALASSLTAASLALGVMLVVAILLIHGIVGDSFRNNSSLGFNIIAGARGGDLQMVLNSIYYLSRPVENVPYSFYQDFLPADQRPDGKAGRFASNVSRVVPLCLGDYFRGFRVVGTTPALFNNYVYDEDRNLKFEFQQGGRNFVEWDPEHGFFEAIVGARVARAENIRVGDRIQPTHGEGGAEHDEFVVVGILKPSGTPNDRAVFVNMEGFYLLEGHAKEPPAHEDEHAESTDSGEVASPSTAASQVATAAPSEAAGDKPSGPENTSPTSGSPDGHPSTAHSGTEHAGTEHAGTGHPSTQRLPYEQREVTALLIRTAHPAVAPMLLNMINEGQRARAVLPIREITLLLDMIVAPIQMVFMGVTILICLVSGVSILVSIYNSMSDRRHEIAVMRSLGASRTTVMIVVLLEAIILSVGGGLVGWIGGHLLIGLAAPSIEDRTGVVVSPLEMAPPIDLFSGWVDSPLLDSIGGLAISPELLLVPFLILLAIGVGILPAMSAYRTDVAKALSSG